MNSITAITTKALHRRDAGPAPQPTIDRPSYRYAGDGRFVPANDAAHEECRLWNAYADAWNARTATRSL